MFDETLYRHTADLLAQARHRQWRIACAESCTGGLIAALLTEIPGASDVIGRSFITYSNQAKHDILGVPMKLLANHGAVSREVTEAMAQGLLACTNAHLTLAVSGIAGPTGGSDDKPIGTVHIASAVRNGTLMHKQEIFGDIGRHEIRMASVHTAISILHEQLSKPDNTI